MRNIISFAILLIGLAHLSNCQDDVGVYNVGVGVSDITGPPTGTPLNGYIGWEQAEGIYTRQYARAFIVESISTRDVIAYVTCDMGMIDHSIVSEVAKKLQDRYGQDTFSEKNIMISATHTHSGVSGFMTYFAFALIEGKGFNRHSFWSAVDGVFAAITQAYDSSVPGRLFLASGLLNNTIRNRRPRQYDANPEWERDLYPSNVDNDFTILKIEDVSSNPIGVFTWFPVHPQDFNPGNSNPIVSADHSGVTALLFDQEMNGPGVRPGKGKFVTGVGSANLGDCVTDWTDFGGEDPRPDPTEDTAPYIKRASYSGIKQFNKLSELFHDTEAQTQITGPIRFTHQFVDVDTVQVPTLNETSGEVETLGLCKGAMGVAYFSEFDPEGELWEIVRDLIHPPSEEMVKCQEPKGVILAAGEMFEPWAWGPSIFSIQLFLLGRVSLVGLPGEFTTMSGRRISRAVSSVTGDRVILAGLTNNYINYVATPEEYELQDFEGGATIFGRNTVPVLTTLYGDMAQALVDGDPSSVPPGPTPPSFLDVVRQDIPQFLDPPPPSGLFFGSVLNDTNESYDRAVDTQVRVVFVGGSPRNSPLRTGTFLVVEKEEEGGRWGLWRTDADLDTVFHWGGWDQKEAKITWYINPNTEVGRYRIRHFGYYRMVRDAPLINYSGVSREFIVQ